MKIRVKVPEELSHQQWSTAYHPRIDSWVDEILLWGMETEMDIVFYAMYYPKDEKTGRHSKEVWAVFTVEAKDSFMFSLKWGALLHKGKKSEKEC